MYRNPNFFIVGAPKCGTTSLYWYLKDHPEVFLCTPKEPHFFCNDFFTRQAVKTWDEYQSIFEQADVQRKAIGEASVHYLRSKVAIPEIKRTFGDSKYIVMLRDPVSFLPSYHSQMVYSLTENIEDFKSAWETSQTNLNRPGVPEYIFQPEMVDYINAAMFGEHVQRMLETVPREDVLFLEFDEFRRNTQAAYRRVLAHLGVADDGREDFSVVNPNKVARSKTLYSFFKRAKLLRHSIPGGAIKRGLSSIRRSILDWNRKEVTRKPVPTSVTEDICRHFSEDKQLVAKLTNLDVSHWLNGANEKAPEEQH